MEKTLEKLLELLLKHRKEFRSYTLKVHESCLSLRVDDIEEDSKLYLYIGGLLTHLKFERYVREKYLSKMGDSILVNLDF